MKELYLNLCDKPILIENGRKSFSQNKPSGRKCFMLSAKSLEIAWKNYRLCWRWDSDPESRFDQVAHLLRVPTLTIIGKISARIYAIPSNMVHSIPRVRVFHSPFRIETKEWLFTSLRV